MQRMVRIARIVAACLVAVVVLALSVFVYQGRQTPAGTPEYVALGSSFAAGAGLGSLEPGSPLLCARSVAGYPQRLAATLHLSLVDMSCGGAVTTSLLNGGQFFQGPQIRVIDARTRLVTITVGGNDVGLVGDLSLLALGHSKGPAGWLTARLWHGPRTPDQRPFAPFADTLTALIRAVRTKAPQASVVVATYPAILPAQGTCARLRLTAADAALMRGVETRLANATRTATSRSGAILVDMHALGAAHNACAEQPWTHGWAKLSEAPFHPTLAGAQATADAIAAALRASPAGVAAVR